MPLKLSISKTKEILRKENLISKEGISHSLSLNDECYQFISSKDLSYEDKIKLWQEESEKDTRLTWLEPYTIKEKLSNTYIDLLISSTKENLNKLNLNHHRRYFKSDCEYCNNLVKNCSFLVGFHPDQATEDIIDLGLKYNKPFAVVPCCVYPSLFPERKDQEGKQVRTYEQFLDYLQSKNNNLKRELIPTIAGPNNFCIYFIPQ